MTKLDFASLDMKQALKEDIYEEKLKELQKQLRVIQQAYLTTGNSAAIVFEGWDAAGKGGTIRRITSALDPRGFKVWPISAPKDYYKERHYLTRFWERLPPQGSLSIFDRSWYGRVLVERVEEFISKTEWRRSYSEINHFEQTLIDNGTRVIKFFLYITPDEQLDRFKKRLFDPVKRWKLSYEDFRNRKKWKAYEEAALDMFDKTSSKDAPWYLVPANDKKFARIEVISRLCEQLSENIDLTPAPISSDLLEEAQKLIDIEVDVMKELSGQMT